MKMQTKLLPCPFCGGEMEIINVKESPLFFKDFIFKCKNQCVESVHSFRTEEEAIKACNTRKPMERIVEQLEEKSNDIPIQYERNYEKGFGDGIDSSIEIINQVEQQYNNGWIPVSERYPENDDYILLSFANFPLPAIGRWEEDEEGGAFYAGDEDTSLVSQGMIVNAWMELPRAYREENN